MQKGPAWETVGKDEPDGEGVSRKLPLAWTKFNEHTIVMANQFLVQHFGEMFVLAAGQVMPPPLLGTAEENKEAIDSLSHVPISTLARIGMTRTAMSELIAVLQRNLDSYDKMKRAHSGPTDRDGGE